MATQTFSTEQEVLERLLDALGSRRFLRCPLVRSEKLDNTLRGALATCEPLKVVLLWGKGRKAEPDLAERYAGRFLVRYAERIQRVWSQGVRYSVLFADTHAALNGHSDVEANLYFRGVQSALASVVQQFGFLSDLWRMADIRWASLVHKATALDEREWAALDARLNLVAGAARHSVRGCPAWSARLYYVVRRAEAEVLAGAFRDSLYATSEGSERMSLQPDLPVLHLYSWSRGRCVRPWNAVIPAVTCVESADALEPCAA